MNQQEEGNEHGREGTDTVNDSASFAAGFTPRSGPTTSSATNVAENYFATITTAEGIVSQKQSSPNPNTGNVFGPNNDNRNL